MLRFYITEEGTLGEPYVEKKKEKEKALIPGAGLAGLFDDEDEDWDGDVPDVSRDFARIQSGKMEEDEDKLPLTADFEERPDKSLALVRWPRLKRPALIPDQVEGKPVTAIAATAFAPFHIEEKRFADLYSSPISFSIFSMRMGKYTQTEDRNEGGPTSVRLPRFLTHIGEHAFWHCDHLTEVTIPAGVTSLPAGVFGDCRALERVILPEGMTAIGYMPRPTDQLMPDIGTFAGCHSLKELTLPSTVTALGAHLFNSCGIVRLRVAAGRQTVQVAQTAFDHSAALRWLDLVSASAGVRYEVALPPARDKILNGDRRFGALLRIPSDFFAQPVDYFDALARKAFRLDFSSQMALSRLQYSEGLAAEDRRWYFGLLVQYFDHAPQFYQEKNEEAACRRLFDFLKDLPDLTASDMSEILRQAGQMGLSADLIAEMMEVRTKRFSTVTGFEDLDLDLDDL